MEVENGKSLTITAGDGQTSNWYTKVHGDESTSLYYVGSDSDSTVLNIDSLVTAGTAFEGNSLFTTDFKGKVYFQNITANLKAADALGNASLLKTEDSVLNLYNDISVGSLQVVGSRIEFVDSAAREIKVSDDASIDENSKIAGDSKVISVGGDLFVESDNSEFTNSAVSATNIEVKLVDAFGEGTSSKATNQYVFDGAKGIQKNAIEANSIVLEEGADIIYDAHSTIKTSTTILSNASRLKVENQSQLGSSVAFDRQTGKSRSQLVLVSSGDLSVGSSENLTFSGDGLTILRASSQSNKINISENVNFSQYSGWVRVESGNFALTEEIAQQFNANDADSKTTGLSIGENGIVSVTGDKSIALDRLGWVSVSNKDSVGILDLSDFVFSDRNTAALTVEDVSVTDGVIRVDSNEVLDELATDQAEGSVFSLDDGKVGQLLVETSLTSEAAGLIELRDKDGSKITSEKTGEQSFISSNDPNKKNIAAVGTWDVDAGYREQNSEQGINQDGIYIRYSLNHLQLVNGSSDVGAVSPLEWNSALVAEGDASSKRLTVEIDGHGVLEVHQGIATDFVLIDNVNNGYSGATVVGADTNLNFTANTNTGSLGVSSVVLAGANSNLTFVDSQSEGQIIQGLQKINGLWTAEGNHTISLGTRNQLLIVGNGEQWSTGSSIKYGISNDSGNVLSSGTVLTGNGILSIGNDADPTVEISLTAESADTFNGFDGVVRLSGKNSVLTIEGDEDLIDGTFTAVENSGANIIFNQNVLIGKGEAGADFSEYSGTLTLAQDKTLTVNGSFDELYSAASLMANSSTIVLSGVNGTFENTVEGSGSKLELIGDSVVTLDGDAGQKAAVDDVAIDQTSTLTLVKGLDGNGGFEEFQDNGQNAVKFSGAGTLVLSGYSLNDFKINLEGLQGKLNLTNLSSFELSRSTNYSLGLTDGTTLVVRSSGLSLGKEGNYKDLTIEGRATLDLTHAEAGGSDPLFRVDTLTQAGDAKLLVKIGKEQQSGDIQSKDLLEQDEGWERLLVDSVSNDGVSGNVVEITTDNGEAVENASYTQILKSDGDSKVTGTYVLGSLVDKGDVSLTYKLTALAIDDGVEYELSAPDLSGGNQDSRDLSVVLTGEGKLNIGGDLILENSEGSDFSGIYALKENSSLSLNGVVSSATVQFAPIGSDLNIGSNQTLTLKGSGVAAQINFTGSQDPLTLTLVGENALGNGSSIQSRTNDKVVLSGATGSGSSAATLRIDGAQSLLNGFAGLWEVQQGAVLPLADSVATAEAGSLDRVSSLADSTIDLEKGVYRLSADHIKVAGLLTVESGATLQLSGWTTDDGDFVQGSGTIDGNGTVVLNEGSVVVVSEDKVGSFLGKWDLGSDPSFGETLTVQGTLHSASTVVLGAGDTLDFVGQEVSSEVNEIASAVNAGASKTGTLKISNGSYRVTSDVNVSQIDVTSGASLNLTKKEQFAETLKINGTLGYESQAENETFVLSEAVIKNDSDPDNLLEKVLQFNLKGGTLDLGENLDFSDFDGKIRLISGTYEYVNEDQKYFAKNENGTNVGFAIAGNGTFVVGGNTTVEMESFGWDRVRGQQTSGTLDLTGFNSNPQSPALNVETLHVANGSRVNLNLSDWVGTDNPGASQGNILDLDNGDEAGRVWLIKADSVSGDADTVQLLNNGGATPSSVKSDIMDGSTKVATGTWNYQAHVEKEEDTKGVYLGFGLTAIHLEGFSSSDPDAALHIDATTTTANDNTLVAVLTGKGNIVVKSGDQSSVTFNYASSGPGSEGYLESVMTVTEGSSLVTMQSYNLGYSTVTLEVGASYSMGNGGSAEPSVLVENLLQLNVQDGASVTLNGNTLQLQSAYFAKTSKVQDGMVSGYDQSRIVALDEVNFDAASQNLQKYRGVLEIAQDAKMIFGGEAEDTFVLGNLTGKGTAVIGVNTQVADASDFTGMFDVAQNTKLTFNDETKLAGDEGSAATDFASVTLGAGAVLDNSERGETHLESLVVNDGSKLNLGTIAMLGTGFASGALSVKDFKGPQTGLAEINVTVNPNEVATDNILSIDNTAGQTTYVVTSENGGLSSAKVQVKILDENGGVVDQNQNVKGQLKDGDDVLGDLFYSYGTVLDDKLIGVNMKATSLVLHEGKELNLSADAGVADEDRTLDLELTGDQGIVNVNGGNLIFTNVNKFGALNVDADAELTLKDTQYLSQGGRIDGQIQAEQDLNAIVLKDAAQLTISSHQAELKGSITLGADSKLTLDGTKDGFGTSASDSILEGAVLGEGTLELDSVNGVLDTQIGSADGKVSLSIVGESHVTMDKSETLKQSNISQISVGDGAHRSDLVVNATSVGVADNVDVVLNSGSLLQYNVDVSDPDATGITGNDETGYQIRGNIGDLQGDGALVINLKNAEGKNYELVMQADSTAFGGIFGLQNGTFVFGDAAIDRAANSALAGNASRLVVGTGSTFRLEGKQTVKDFFIANNGILDLSASGSNEQPGQSDNLLTVGDGGVFEGTSQGTSYIRVDTEGLTTNDTLNGQITFEGNHFAAILASAVEESQKAPFYQIVDGTIGNVSNIKLLDKNGNLITDGQYSIKLYQDGKNIADLVGGIGLVKGEQGEDLFVTQTVLGANLHQTIVLEGDNVNIGQWLRADADNVGLQISEGSNVTLSNSTNSLTGTVDVLTGAVLTLGESNVLGGGTEESSYASSLNVAGKVVFGDDVSQTVNDLKVLTGGQLDLGSNGSLDVALEGTEESALIDGAVFGDASSQINFERGTVAVLGNADFSGMNGTWKLGSEAAMHFAVTGEDESFSMTTGRIEGGRILKTGQGDLTLGYSVVNGNAVAVDVQGGSLDIAGWNNGNALTLKSLSLKGSEFDLAGDLNTADGFNADGATIWVGSRNYEDNPVFADRVINGGYSGNATFKFNVRLGAEESLGDKLTINGGVEADSHAGLYVNLVGADANAVKGLTLLKVEQTEGNAVAEDFATLANKNTVEAGGYDWYLTSKVDGDYRDYYFTNKIDDPNGGNSGNGDKPSDPTISVRFGSLAAFAASVDMFDMNIHDRQGIRPWINPVTGEKTTTSLWMRQTLSKESNRDSSGQLSGDTQENVTMIGGDILQFSPGGSGLVYAGLMGGYGESNYDGTTNRSSDGSKGDTEAWMVGAYAGWNQNDPKIDRSGAYVSGWVQYAHFSSDITRTGERTLEAKAQGLSASLEAGWVLKAAEFQMQGGETKGAFYVEPHAQVTWWGADYDSIDGEDIRFEGQHNITTRLGARFTMETSGATNFSPYLEANWVHNTKDYGASWGEVESYVEGEGNQAELKFGAETFFTDAFSGYAQIRANWGGDGYNRQEGSVGLKYRW